MHKAATRQFGQPGSTMAVPTAVKWQQHGNEEEVSRAVQVAGMGVNSLNKCISTVKTILSEACFRGDIDNNPGSMVGNIKYERQERGVLNPEEVGSILAFISRLAISCARRVVVAVP